MLKPAATPAGPPNPPAIRGWIVTVADNLLVTAEAGGATTTLTSEPLRLRGEDRISVIASTHFIFGGTTSRTLLYRCAVSLDGVSWVPQGPTDQLIAPVVMAPQVGSVYGAFVRFTYEFTVVGGSGTGAICFDLHARLDKI